MGDGMKINTIGGEVTYHDVDEDTPPILVDQLERLARSGIDVSFTESPQFYALLSNEPVGVITADIFPTTNGEYYRPSVVVHSDYRGAGIGGKLLRMALDYYTKEEQVNGIGLSVTAVNPIVAKLMRDWGYTQISSTNNGKPVFGIHPIVSDEEDGGDFF